MKTRRILFVNSDPGEIETMMQIVHRLGNGFSVHAVQNGREALSMLMGTNSELVKPDLIIASSVLPDMSAFELLSIVRKYYSLVNLKFYLLTDRAENADHTFDPFMVDGYLHRPLCNDVKTLEKVSRLAKGTDILRLTAIGGIATHAGFLKAWTIVKQKITVALKPLWVMTKVATVVTCTAVPWVIFTGLKEEEGTAKTKSVHEFTQLGAPKPVKVTLPPETIPQEVTPVQETPVVIIEEPVQVVQPAEPDTIPSDIPVVNPDTSVHKKKFSIGVKPSGR